MNKEELVTAVSKASGTSKKDTNSVITAFINTVESTLASGEKVTLVGFGTFEVKERAAREGRNPKTGAVLQIAAKKAPTFSAGKLLKQAVN